MATANDNIAAVELILNTNLETLDYQDDKGNTALMRAIKCDGVQTNTFAIIQLLILSGARLDLFNNEGNNAKQLASWNKQIEKQYDDSVKKLEMTKPRNFPPDGFFYQKNEPNDKNTVDKISSTLKNG